MKSKLLFLLLVLSLSGLGGVRPVDAKAADDAALVGSLSVTQAELDEAAKDSMAQIELEIYEAKRAALNQLIEKRLLELEAKSEGITVEALEAKIKAGVTPVTDQTVQQYYDSNKDRIQEPFDAVKEKIRGYLASQAESSARAAALTQYRGKFPVKIFLKSPRIELQIPKDAMSRGPIDAPVQIVSFTDFQCPFCKRGAEVITQVLQNYPGKVRIIHQDYPLPFHSNAVMAANAAHCAGEQNQFWAYHDLLFANQNALDKESLKKYAAGLTLDTAAFNACLDSARYQKVIDRSLADGRRYGVQGTPGYFINGRPIRGALPYESFREIIDEELSS